MFDALQNFSAELDKIQGWPVALIVVAVCVIVGYLLKFVPTFPNQSIPLVVILFGSLLTVLLADVNPTGAPLRLWLTRNSAVGLIFGFIAWILHNALLVRFETWLASRFEVVNTLLSNTKQKQEPQPKVENGQEKR